MQESFFITGGSLRADAPSYVERAADNELYESLCRGEFCYVLTSRQLGKSSLMVRTAARLRVNGEQVAVLDLTAVGHNVTPEQWYDGLLMRLGEQIGHGELLEEFWSRNSRLGPLQRFMSALRWMANQSAPSRSLIIFIDEIDTVRSLPFSTDEFFAAIRECHNRRAEQPSDHRLTFCLLGVATPTDLIRDPRLTPFNVGRRIELADFSTPEAQRLATGLAPAAAVGNRRQGDRAQRLLRRILHWTGGHPYLTQRLCRAVEETQGTNRRPDQGRDPSAAIDTLCGELFLSAQARERDDNLIAVRERLIRGSSDLGGLIDLYSRVRSGRRCPPDDTNVVLDALRLSGLVKLVGNRLMVRNRIYARVFDGNWLRAHLPDAEARRQREAYRRGVTRTAAVAGLLIAAMLGLTTWAVRQTLNAERRSRDVRIALAGETSARAAERAQRQIALEQGRFAELGKQEALRAERVAEAESRRARAEQAHAIREKQRAERAEQIARNGAELAGRAHYVAAMALTQTERERGNGLQTGLLLKETRHSPNLGFEWGYWQLRTPRLVHTVKEPGVDLPRRRGSLRERDELPSPLPCTTAISSDGQVVLCASVGGKASLITPDGVRRNWPLPEPLPPVRTLCLSARGARALILAVDGTVQLWDVPSARRLLQLPANPGVRAVALSPGGDRILMAQESSVLTLDIQGRRVGEQAGLQTSALAFSDDGLRAIAGGDSTGARIWNVATGEPVQTLKATMGTNSPDTWVCFAPDGDRVATVDGMSRVTLWALSTGQLLRSFRRHTADIQSARFSPDSKRLVTASLDRTIRIWDTETGEQIQMLPGDSDALCSAAFLANGRRVVTCGDRTVRIWEVEHPSATRTLSGEATITVPVAFSRDGQRLLTFNDNEQIQIWSVRTLRPIDEFSAEQMGFTVPAFSASGKLVAVGAESGEVTLWRSGSSEPQSHLRGHTGQVYWCDFSPSATLLATGSKDHTARIWDLRTGRTTHRLTGHTDEVFGVSFSPDGRVLLTGSIDGTARLWDCSTGRCLGVLRAEDPSAGAVSAVAFSPNGHILLAGYQDGSTRRWEFPGLRRLRTLPASNEMVLPAAFSPNGRRILTGRILSSFEGGDVGGAAKRSFASLVLWDSETGRQVLTLGDTGFGAAFSPDGAVIAVGGLDGQVHLHSGTPSGGTVRRMPPTHASSHRPSLP